MEILRKKVDETNLRDLAILSVFALYALGYLISSLYLGSLGVLNFNILSTRYLLIGLLFSIYISILFFPLLGLYQRLEKETLGKNRPWKKLLEFFSVTVTVFAINTVAIAAFDRLFAFNTLPTGIPGFTDEVNRNLTYFDIFGDFLLWVMWFEIAFFALAILATVSLFLYNSIFKKPKRTSWFTLLKESGAHVWSTMFGNPKLHMIIVSFILFINVSLSGVRGLNSSNIYLTNRGIEWGRLGIVIFVIYLLFASLIFAYSFIQSSPLSRSKKKNADLLDKIDDLIPPVFALYSLVLLAISVYALHVYPLIPQQLGGGKSLEVAVTTRTIELDNSMSFYLVDSASDGYVFIGVDNSGALKAFNITSDEVLSIEFLQEINKKSK